MTAFTKKKDNLRIDNSDKKQQIAVREREREREGDPGLDSSSN